MKINHNQQNITFKENVIIRFAERPRGDIRSVAKEFAVTEKKIDSADNVGVALFVNNLKILVLDKTVEISSSLREAFYKIINIGNRIKRHQEMYRENLDQARINALKDKQKQAQKEYDEIFQKIVSNAKTIDYKG